mgnify:CR=1 FL=1
MKWTLNNAGYLCATIKRKNWFQHRYVWTQHNGPIADGMVIHHINGIKTDNRIENLALVTRTQNEQKMDKVGKGYTYDKHNNKYLAYRNIDGKIRNLGRFVTECGAYMANRMAYITHRMAFTTD